MEEVQGDAAFAAFPGETFRFSVGHTGGNGKISLESQSLNKRWTCLVTDVAAFAPADVVLPQHTVLHYVAASLKESIDAVDDANRGPNLVRGDEDKILQLEVLIKLGVADFAWAPKYVFLLTLESHTSSTMVQADEIALLNAQVQKLQQEVDMLKSQMQAVLQTQAASHARAVPSPARSRSLVSEVSCPSSELVAVSNAIKNQETVATIPSRGPQVWSDVVGHSQHRLVQTDEIRETRNALGMIVRSHRQHTCKVCSLLRENRKRPSGTSYYCPECTERHDGGMVFLCDKIRPHDPREYKNATCSQIWHLMWKNGENLPQSGTSSIRMRKKRKESRLG